MTASSYPAVFSDVFAILHCAAFFRESFSGGRHWDELFRVNVEGTGHLLDAAYEAGVRRLVSISSIAVLYGPRGHLLNENSLRKLEECPDDYYRSKILQDQVVDKFLEAHPDFFSCSILPGWMHGPGDLGPTSAGQTVVDFCTGKLPGIPKASFSVVDARDVAFGVMSAMEVGKRGEKYIAAGEHMTFTDICVELEHVSGVKAPTMHVPPPLMYTMAFFMELGHKITKKPVLVSMATIKLMNQEYDRTHFDSSKAMSELGVMFRPPAQTFADEIAWFKTQKIF